MNSYTTTKLRTNLPEPMLFVEPNQVNLADEDLVAKELDQGLKNIPYYY